MVETAVVRQVMWFVILEYAKNRVIGVDTSGQKVSLRVRYGMTCLIISDVVGIVFSLGEWEFGIVTRSGSHGGRRAMVSRLPQKTLAMLWYCVLS
jgi:hypothetical protein